MALGVADAIRVGVGGRLGLGPAGWFGLVGTSPIVWALLGVAFAAALSWWRDGRLRAPAIVLGSLPFVAVALDVLWSYLPSVGDAVPPGAVGLVALAFGTVLVVGSGRVRFLRLGLAVVVLAAPLVSMLGGRLTVPPGQAVGAEHPNLLLITVDGLRADRLNAGAELPGFARLAAEGTRLDALVSGATSASAAADVLLHARSASEGTGASRGLLQSLSSQGYAIGVFSASPLELDDLAHAHVVDDDPSWPLGMGRTLLGQCLARMDVIEPRVSRRADEVAQRAIRFLARRGGRRVAWVHLEDPLPPYVPTSPFDVRYDPGRDPKASGARPLADRAMLAPAHEGALDQVTDLEWTRARYAAEVAAVDAAVSSLLAAVDAQGGSSSTVIALVGLRGSALDESTVWFGADGPLHPSRVQVPGLLRWAGHIPAGGHVRTPSELGDVGATLREVLGLDPDGASAPSLRPTYEDRGIARSAAVVAWGHSVLLRTGGAFLWWTPEQRYQVLRVSSEPTAWTVDRIAELFRELPGERTPPTREELVRMRDELVPQLAPAGARTVAP